MTEYQLPKAYDFKSTEPRIYEMWEQGGYFQPSNDPNQPDFDPSRKPFVISIPPPNVTGELHHRSRHVRGDGRPDDPLPPHEGHPVAVGARHRPCRDRHPVAGGEGPAAYRGSDPRGTRAREIPGTRLGLEGKISPASSASRSAGWAPPATGAASASPSTMACRRRFARPSCACTRRD